MVVLQLRQELDKIILEHVVVPTSKKVLKKLWGHVKRTQKSNEKLPMAKTGPV
jgi:hypothetical protein